MIQVLFFASLRERLGCSELSLPFTSSVATIADLRQALILERGSVWEEALTADNVILAVNQQVVDDQTSLADGDEVAFFPPVTGG